MTRLARWQRVMSVLLGAILLGIGIFGAVVGRGWAGAVFSVVGAGFLGAALFGVGPGA